MTIDIKNRRVELKYTIRMFVMFEQLMDKTFDATRITDITVLFYTCLVSSDRELKLSLEEAIDYADESPETITVFADWLGGEIRKQSELIEQSGSKKKD